MNGNAKIGPVPNGPVIKSSATSQGGFQDSKASRDAERAAQYRLVIEEGATEGSFIYKIMDRVTGEVVRQLPREKVVDLMRGGDYSSGSVIDTNA